LGRGHPPLCRRRLQAAALADENGSEIAPLHHLLERVADCDRALMIMIFSYCMDAKDSNESFASFNPNSDSLK
jgi:hypothetical protein